MNDKKFVSADLLKWIALITMFIDHIGAGIIEKCYITAPNMILVDKIIRNIGRPAFPIFCFLLVEGYKHTRNRWKYGLNLFIFALISEIPFDFLFREKLTLQYQNVYLTLLIGLLAIMAAGTIEKQEWKFGILLEIVVVVAIAYTAELLHTDYNSWGVLLIFILFLTRNKPIWVTCLAGSLFMLTSRSEYAGIIAFIFIFFYNSKRSGKINKYVFYGLYPAHLALYCGIRYLLMNFI